MKIIHPKIHSFIDYTVSVLLILFPWIFGYELDNGAAWLPLILGVASLTYSVFTRYRDGHFGIIPFKTHLMLDIGVAIILIVGPWISEFGDRPPYIQTVLGLMIILIVSMTKSLPYGKITPEGDSGTSR
jgi:hypothetical protein